MAQGFLGLIENNELRTYVRFSRQVWTDEIPILLDVRVETALDRIKQRGRDFEQVADRCYMYALRDAFMVHKHANTIVANAEGSVDEVVDRILLEVRK